MIKDDCAITRDLFHGECNLKQCFIGFDMRFLFCNLSNYYDNETPQTDVLKND